MPANLYPKTEPESLWSQFMNQYSIYVLILLLSIFILLVTVLVFTILTGGHSTVTGTEANLYYNQLEAII